MSFQTYAVLQEKRITPCNVTPNSLWQLTLHWWLLCSHLCWIHRGRMTRSIWRCEWHFSVRWLQQWNVVVFGNHNDGVSRMSPMGACRISFQGIHSWNNWPRPIPTSTTQITPEYRNTVKCFAVLYFLKHLSTITLDLQVN